MRTRTTAHVSRTGPDNKNENLQIEYGLRQSGTGSGSHDGPPSRCQVVLVAVRVEDRPARESARAPPPGVLDAQHVPRQGDRQRPGRGL